MFISWHAPSIVKLGLFINISDMKGIHMSNKVWLTVRELADRLDVPISWVYTNHRREGIPSKKFGGHLRFLLEDIERWERT